MSTRHKARLLGLSNQFSHHLQNEREDREEDEEMVEKEEISFSLLNDSENSSQSDEEEEENDEDENGRDEEEEYKDRSENKEQKENQKGNLKHSNKKQLKLNKKNKNKNSDDICDEINELTMKENEQNSIDYSNNSSRIDQFLYVNPNELDVNSLLKRRFRSSELQQEEGNKRIIGNRNRNSNNSVISRSHIFCKSKIEWPRPLTSLTGGVNFIYCSSPEWFHQEKQEKEEEVIWCRFIYSIDYQKTQKEFEIICNTGDINLLILFLSVNSTHFDSLYNLSLFFSRTGDMDKALDLIQRCLYYQENVTIGTIFSSWRSISNHQSFQLSYSYIENQIYFKALFLYMQIIWMKGCRSMAVDIAKVILSLDPQIDPMNILLLIDRYFLITARYEGIQQFCQLSSAQVLRLPFLDQSNERLVLHEILPNWAYSFCLSNRLSQKQSSSLSSLQPLDQNSQSIFIEYCLKRFPVMLWYIIDESLLSSNDLNTWNQIKSHQYFQHFSSLKRFYFHISFSLLIPRPLSNILNIFF